MWTLSIWYCLAKPTVPIALNAKYTEVPFIPLILIDGCLCNSVVKHERLSISRT